VTVQVPFLDLKAQYASLRLEIREAVDEVLDSQICIGGPVVRRFEEAIASRFGVRHAIGVSSGTDALLASLMALGVGPGDEVVTSPFTFFAPVGAIMRLGARPVFVDIDESTFNLDAALLSEALTARTKAIIPVHLFGQTANMTEILAVAGERGIPVVEDAAQAIGARHGERFAATMGTAGCFSFFPSKNLGAAGDAGMVLTDDDDLAAVLRRVCQHGASPKYHHVMVGGNFRLDPIQAAILLVKLDRLDGWTAARRRHGAAYDEAFADLSGLVTPVVSKENFSVYNQYVLRVGERDGLMEQLSARGVGSAVYYPSPMHQQPALAHLGQDKQAFPRAEAACQEALAIPVYPELTELERAYVIENVREFAIERAR
jgi:dTDP-4-amino-4,6-dideoxygalactose transaminase